MADSTLIDPPVEAPLGGKRGQVLAHLRAADRPLSVTDLAEVAGLHVNTARFHLDALVNDGLAERAVEPRETPGRPRVLYTAAGALPGPRSFGFLAEMLTGLVAALPDAGQAANDAGRAWGRHLVDRPAPSQRVHEDEATERLNRVLDAIGFQPDSTPSDDGVEVRLRHCPFREVAERHTDVVCAIHLGLMRGALEELRAPLEAESLTPFVGPSLCVAQLRRSPAA